MRALILSAFFAASLAAQTYEARIKQAIEKVDAIVAKGPYKAAWSSLENYTVPDWYADAKFGIFIHWGVYAVPAFGNEWYPRNMYIEGSREFKYHLERYGPQLKFGYKDFIPMFRADRYRPEDWASLFKKAGAKFIVPVAEHHDGFPLYDCSFTEWSAAKMGPKRDLVGDLAVAVRKQGLHFGASSHRAEHWWFFDSGMKFDSDVRDPRNLGLYGPAQPRQVAGTKKENQPDEAHMTDWLARTSEIVDKYKPELIWFDWWIEQPVFQPYLQRFAAFYYNRGAEWKRGVAINYKNESFPEKAAVLDIERGKLDKIRPRLWQTDTSISLRSWGYIEHDEFRSVDSLIDDLVDIVSKNGVLLLNIGPKADGTIPDEEQMTLVEMGRWLAVNGEAIYGTRPWKVYGEGPTEVLKGGFTDRKSKPFTAKDVRFTTRQDYLYAVALGKPQGNLEIRSLGEKAGLLDKKISSISLLGTQGKVKWQRTAEALSIDMPAGAACESACAFKITLAK